MVTDLQENSYVFSNKNRFFLNSISQVTKLFQLSHYHDWKKDLLHLHIVCMENYFLHVRKWSLISREFQIKKVIFAKPISTIPCHFIWNYIAYCIKRPWNAPLSMIVYVLKLALKQMTLFRGIQLNS